jgi:hypothetical protein
VLCAEWTRPEAPEAGFRSCYSLHTPVKQSVALSHTCLPTALPSRSPCLMWIPPYRRDMPASSAAAEKVCHVITTSSRGVMLGSTNEDPALTVVV